MGVHRLRCMLALDDSPQLMERATTHPLSLDQLTVLGATPVELVTLAAANGCSHVGIYFQSWNVMPAYDLHQDAQADALLRSCREHDVRIAVAEPFLLLPDTSLDTLMPNLELAAKLQVQAVNAVGFDPDIARLTDTFGSLSERAARLGLATLIEFFPLSTVTSIQMAERLIRGVGRPDVRLNVDVLHLVRSGGTAADLVSLEPALIGHVQLSDGPASIAATGMMTEATEERGLPGEGEFPLRDILAALPAGVTIGVEVPSLRRLRTGVASADWARVAVDAMKAALGSWDPSTIAPPKKIKH
jgi:sugar phosphate isomerase/epimerase